jgi:enoyl-CoA hydratase
MARVQVDQIDGVAVVRLANGKVNALDLELLEEITDVFQEITADSVVLTGAGPNFSAGVDLWRVVEGGSDYVRAFLPALDRAFLAVFGLGKPTVAAINGHAVAGGAILAAACDHRVMATGRGTIGVTGMRIGMAFPPTALEILAYGFGEPGARRTALTGRTLAPAEALAAGYVDELATPDLLVGTAVARARPPASPDAYRLTKQLLQGPVHERLARTRPVFDPRILDLWLDAIEDGRIARYMASLGARDGAR